MNTGFFNMFGGFQNFLLQFNQFKQNAQSQGLNPQQLVQQKLNSGEMSQEQFNQLRNMANLITGKRM